jgi:Transposase IS4
MKTVKVVQKLVELFVGSYRTAYVDRFYTSLELAMLLAEKKLFITGIMLQKNVPPGIRIR